MRPMAITITQGLMRVLTNQTHKLNREITHNSFELLHKQQQYQKVANHTAADWFAAHEHPDTHARAWPASQIRLFVAYAQIQWHKQNHTTPSVHHNTIHMCICTQRCRRSLYTSASASSSTFSLEISSSDMPLDSGTNTDMSMPRKLVPASTKSVLRMPMPGE